MGVLRIASLIEIFVWDSFVFVYQSICVMWWFLFQLFHISFFLASSDQICYCCWGFKRLYLRGSIQAISCQAGKNTGVYLYCQQYLQKSYYFNFNPKLYHNKGRCNEKEFAFLLFMQLCVKFQILVD